MDKNARSNHAKRPMTASSKAGGLQPDLQAVPNSPPSCMDMGCLCQYIGGGTCKKAVRKEYRRLSANERSKFHAAMNQLKQSGEFTRITNIHSQLATSSGAHAGPAFLPWHREYIK
uniref:Tyrosinase copper-binding domain-containing protein n=1 Tax=Plectus sambesii TaxID=2011161 RepID=A0A914XCE5_9BILA